MGKLEESVMAEIYYQQYSDEELILFVTEQREEFTAEALAAIEQELLRRGYTLDAIQRDFAQMQQLRERQRRDQKRLSGEQLVSVFRFSDISQAVLLEAFLKDQGITPLIRTRYDSAYGGLFSGPRAERGEILVVEEQSDRAKQLIKEFQEH